MKLRKEENHWISRLCPCIMSSDAKALQKEDCANNYIGMRHTWIKMSEPSIEALRQAFLDHHSRIRLSTARPEDAYDYPKILKIRARDTAFLSDCDASFSPNLNAIIGGRGSGKSTLLEYLRIALCQHDSIKGEGPTKNFGKLKKTLQSHSVLQLDLGKDGQMISIESAGGNPPIITQGPEIPDLARFFPVRVLSQHEIYEISEDKDAQMSLVENVVSRKLDEYMRKGSDIISEIQGLNRQIELLPGLLERKRALVTESRDLEGRIAHLRNLQAPLAKWEGILAEERFFSAISDELSSLGDRLNHLSNDVISKEIYFDSELLSKAPHNELTKKIKAQADALKNILKQEIEKSVSKYQEDVSKLFNQQNVIDWYNELEKERTSFETLRGGLASEGTEPDLYLSYQEDYRAHQENLSKIEKKIDAISATGKYLEGNTTPEGKKIPGLIDELHNLWLKETKERVRAALSLQEAVPITTNGNPFVIISVNEFGDEDAFLERLRAEMGDRRRITQDDWDSFMREVFTYAKSICEIPTEILFECIMQYKRGVKPDICHWQIGDKRVRVLLDWITEEKLSELRLWRTPDLIKVTLYR